MSVLQVSMKQIHELVSLYYKALHEEPCVSNLSKQVLKKRKTQQIVGGNHSNHVTVYGKSYCPYCQEAKTLIKDHPQATYIELTENYKPSSNAHVKHIQKAKTIPIIFVEDDLIGGLTELKKFLDK